jgi:hypothetical protein
LLRRSLALIELGLLAAVVVAAQRLQALIYPQERVGAVQAGLQLKHCN